MLFHVGPSYSATCQRLPIKLHKRIYHRINLSNVMKLASEPDVSDVEFYARSCARVRFYVPLVLFLQFRFEFCTFFVTDADIAFLM